MEDSRWRRPWESIMRKYGKVNATWNGVNLATSSMMSGWNDGDFFDMLAAACDKDHPLHDIAKNQSIQSINQKTGKATPLSTAHFYARELHNLFGEVAGARPSNDNSCVFDHGTTVQVPARRSLMMTCTLKRKLNRGMMTSQPLLHPFSSTRLLLPRELAMEEAFTGGAAASGGSGRVPSLARARRPVPQASISTGMKRKSMGSRAEDIAAKVASADVHRHQENGAGGSMVAAMQCLAQAMTESIRQRNTVADTTFRPVVSASHTRMELMKEMQMLSESYNKHQFFTGRIQRTVGRVEGKVPCPEGLMMLMLMCSCEFGLVVHVQHGALVASKVCVMQTNYLL
eukprot:349679-Chlamydomonas_euryale.AAC.4